MLFLPLLSFFLGTVLWSSLRPAPWVTDPPEPWTKRIGQATKATAVVNVLGDFFDAVPTILRADNAPWLYNPAPGSPSYSQIDTWDVFYSETDHSTLRLNEHLIVNEPAPSAPATRTRGSSEATTSRTPLSYSLPIYVVAAGTIVGYLVLGLRTLLYRTPPPSPALVPDLTDCDIVYQISPVVVNDFAATMVDCCEFSLADLYHLVEGESSNLTVIESIPEDQGSRGTVIEEKGPEIIEDEAPGITEENAAEKKPRRRNRPCKKARDRANRKRREEREALDGMCEEGPDSDNSAGPSTLRATAPEFTPPMPPAPPAEAVPFNPRSAANHVLVDQGYGEVWVPRAQVPGQPIQPAVPPVMAMPPMMPPVLPPMPMAAPWHGPPQPAYYPPPPAAGRGRGRRRR